MSNRQRWGYGSFGVGVVLTVVFFALSAASSGGGLKSAFLAAAMLCAVAGANGLAVGISDNVRVGRMVGLIVGAIGFAAWGIAWLTSQCAAGDAACSATKTSFGWAALFSAIAAVASMFPGVFGGTRTARS
jgi:thiamine biosynthesis protein ThiC